MANTEGMPDEFVQSLATGSPAISSSFSPAQGSEGQRLRARRRHDRLQERMDLPMNGSPAAKIIRASPRNHSKNAVKETEQLDKDSSPGTRHEANPFSLIGEVVEHEQKSGRHERNRNTKKVSRFSSRNRQFNPTKNSTKNGVNHVTGFPSVHDVPLGTFVNHKKDKPQKKKNTPITTAKERTEPKFKSRIDNISSQNSHNSMKEASQKESQAMLASMSLQEIKHHQNDIEEALPSDLIEFLKKRRRRKPQASPKTNKNVAAADDISFAASKEALPVSKVDESGMEEVRNEKERMAKLVASIRTHEDLDATYQMEMKDDALYIDFETHDDSGNRDKKKEEFLIACDLLRSSSPRQILWAAKTVSSGLEDLITTTNRQHNNEARVEKDMEQSVECTEQRITVDELPSILSVSLRCLLDKPLNSSCNCLLHTYALQSLYSLIIIYAHPDHDVIYDDSAARTCSNISIFQEDFMDDAVPSPSLDTAYPPMSVQPLKIDKESTSTNSVTAYMTSSPTSSALTDGEDFKKDPMWTLLSKMKIIPRVAFLLEYQQHMVGIPNDAFISICGIISMVGQRSPGAASAIVQHKTLISSLLKRMLEQIQHGHNEDEVKDIKNDKNGIVYSIVRLFCILSRQSRVAAEGLPLEEILPPLLATGLASSVQQFRIQQQALYLWRTMLRYGLGLEAVTSMLTISARHLALPYYNEFSLSSDFISSFTLVLECVKVIWSRSRDNSTDLITAEEELTDSPISRAAKTVAETVLKLMASTLRTILPKPLIPRDHSNLTETDTENKLTLKYRWNSSRLLYFSIWFQLFDTRVCPEIQESIESYISPDHQEILLLTLQAWAQQNADVEKAWNSIPKWCDSSLNFEDISQGDELYVRTEASACAFLNAYFSVTLVLLRSKSPNPHLEVIKQSLHEKLVRIITLGLKSAPETTTKRCNLKSASSLHSVRERWINQCQFAVAKFCFHSISMGHIGKQLELSLVRNLVFSLLGRLQKGNESVAVVLFSSDVLFLTQDNNQQLVTSNPSPSSPISSMFLGEICGSEGRRKQLDHSFKLQHGFGITSAGFGPFQLDSLLSGAEIPSNVTSSSPKENPGDGSFHLGRLWLWQCLSGSIRMSDDVVASDTQEAADVVATVLELIHNLEDHGGYAEQLPIGSKLYYLVNVCLQHEQVLRDERVLSCGEILLDQYLQNFGQKKNHVVDFCQECLNHSGYSSKNSFRHNNEEDNTLDGMDEKLLEEFSSAMTIELKDSKISSEQIRAMVAFLEDLTAAYRDYGAQYNFFTKCVRLFVLPEFPSLLRCRALGELEDMLHLLTVTKELEDEAEMAELLSRSLTGGLPLVDNSIRDDTDFLNAVTKAIASKSRRPLEGYMRHYSIGMLVRNLAISLSTGQGVEISKKRLKRLDAKNVQWVCEATELFFQSRECTKSALVKAIINSSHCKYTDDFNGMSEEQYVARYLDSFIARNASRSVQS